MKYLKHIKKGKMILMKCLKHIEKVYDDVKED